MKKKYFKLLVCCAMLILSFSSWSQINNSIGIKGTATTKPEDSAWGIPMLQSSEDPAIFTAVCTLIAEGDLKFHSDRDGDPNVNSWFYAPEANTPILSASTYVVGTHGVDLNNKWIVGENEGGLYKITIDTSAETIKIEPTAPIAAIVGTATSNGYNLPGLSFTPTSDPNILTWTGDMFVGSFKINLTTGEWNDDYWFTAPAVDTPIMNNGETIANADAIRSIAGNPNDNKWIVSEAGEYKVEVNVATDKITIYDSASLGVATNLMEEKIAIYPNPVANTLSFDNALKGANVSVFSIIGSSILEQKATNNSIDVSNLKSGVYFVVFEKDGVKATNRFVKK
tara:strand:- start:50830 stop:51849 length:1020 start_codon:yes stop_codon:yes gene_type:complete